jgi:hypothetical protein
MKVTALISLMPRRACSASTTGASDQLGTNSAIAASDPVQPFLGVMNGEDQFLQHDLVSRVVKTLLLQPAFMPRPPCRLAGINPSMPQHQRGYRLPLAAEILHGHITSSHQIPQSFVRLIGNPHVGEFSGPEQSGERDGIPPVGLDPVARFAGDQRWRNDNAIVAKTRELAVKSVAGWPRLVAEVQRPVLGGQPRGHLAHALWRGVHLAQITNLAVPARLSNRDRIPTFGNIDPNERFAIVRHGSSSLRWGSARPARASLVHAIVG